MVIVLELKDVSFSYPGSGRDLYTKLSLSFSADERVALLAPSGFGKTTLCRLLAGFEKPSSGYILCDGEPFSKRGVCPVQLIGQHPELVVDRRMRMKETLAEAGDVSASVMQALGIRDEWLSRFPHELSGGEIQRFCIARAVAAQPRYLIADEISTMLDAVTQARVWTFLLDYVQREHVGLIFVSHSAALVSRIATREIHLDNLEANS